MTSPVRPLGVFGPAGPNPFARGGVLVIALMEYTEDVLGGRFGVSGGSGVKTALR